MYLNMSNGEEVWSSRPEWELSRTELRVLSWKFYEGSPGRSALMWSVVCTAMVLSLAMAGLTSWPVAFVTLFAISVLYYALFVEGIARTVEDAARKMRGDHRFRFKQMQKGAPAYDMASCYFDLLHQEQTNPVATDAAVAMNKMDVTAVIKEWLESRWPDDRISVEPEYHDTPIDYVQYRLNATERAVDSFKQLGLPLLWGFDRFCEQLLDEARRDVKKRIRRELKKEQRSVHEARKRISRLQTELDQIDHQVADEQSVKR